MRIVVVHHALDGGGSARAAVELANHLAGSGHAVSLPALTRTADWHYPVLDSVTVHELTRSSQLAPAWRVGLEATPRLRRVVHAFRPDVVVGIGALPNVAVLAATVGTASRIVLSERADPSVMRGRRWSWLRNAVYRRSSVDGFVVLTEATAAIAREWMPPDRVHVIPNPAPDPDTQRPPGGRGEPIVLAMGRLVPQKGFDVLLDAWAQIAGSFPDWRLRIVGDGADRADLEARAVRLGVAPSIDMPGFDPKPFDAMAGAEVFVLSSRYEGFGQVLLQAMACAVPVVATDCPSGPAEILRGGSDGTLVPVEDRRALAEAMSRLMSDPALRDEMGRRALERSKDFRPDRVWAMWDAVLAHVVARR